MIKAIFIFLIIIIAGGFLVNQIPPLKKRIIEVVNPAAKEERVLGELKTNLDNLDSAIGDMGNIKDAATQAKIQKSKKLLQESKNLLGSISELNQKNSGIIQQTIGGIINALTDRTPYPADHLPTTSASPSPAYSCPPR